MEIEGVKVFCRYNEVVPLGDLRAHPRNNNRHPKSQVERLAEVIRGNGWRQPITVSNLSGFITKGHGRLLAARHAGFSSAPVEYQDYADEAAEVADLLADNHIAELAVIDKAQTLANLELLPDVSLSGFSTQDIKALGSTPATEMSGGRELIDEIFSVMVECETEAEQIQVLGRLTEMGFKCRALIS